MNMPGTPGRSSSQMMPTKTFRFSWQQVKQNRGQARFLQSLWQIWDRELPKCLQKKMRWSALKVCRLSSVLSVSYLWAWLQLKWKNAAATSCHWTWVIELWILVYAPLSLGVAERACWHAKVTSCSFWILVQWQTCLCLYFCLSCFVKCTEDKWIKQTLTYWLQMN